MTLKRQLWDATKADGLVAARINLKLGGGASYNKFSMRLFRLGTTQTPNGSRVRSVVGLAAFDAEVNLLGGLLNAVGRPHFVGTGDIRWMVQMLDNAPAVYGTPDFHFILKEDGSRVKEFVVSYNAGGLHGSDNILVAYDQAHATSHFVQTT